MGCGGLGKGLSARGVAPESPGYDQLANAARARAVRAANWDAAVAARYIKSWLTCSSSELGATKVADRQARRQTGGQTEAVKYSASATFGPCAVGEAHNSIGSVVKSRPASDYLVRHMRCCFRRRRRQMESNEIMQWTRGCH